MNSNLETFGTEPFGHGQPMGFFRQLNVKHSLAVVAIKMAMFCHVGTKMCRPPVQSDLPDQSAFNQSIQTIVDGGHRNIRHVALGPNEHFLGGGMVPLLHQHLIDLLALRRKPKTTGGQALGQRRIWSKKVRCRLSLASSPAFGVFVCKGPHC